MKEKDYKNHLLNISKEMDNSTCIDCSSKHPKWVSVYYGTFMCLDCAGVHRSLGIYLDSIKSIGLDTWSKQAYLPVKYGGNKRFREYLKEINFTSNELENKYKSENVIKYSYSLADIIKSTTGTEVKYANANNRTNITRYTSMKTPSPVISHQSSSPENPIYSQTGKHTSNSGKSSIQAKLPEWTSSIATHANTIKDKTISYSIKIGSAVYSHAKNIVSSSSELVSKNLKKPIKEESHKQTHLGQTPTEHNTKKDWT